MENKKVTILIAMDLSAAFDTVDHTILLHILEKEFGITGVPLRWCASYLKDRTFKVNINNEYSEKRVLIILCHKAAATARRITVCKPVP